MGLQGINIMARLLPYCVLTLQQHPVLACQSALTVLKALCNVKLI